MEVIEGNWIVPGLLLAGEVCSEGVGTGGVGWQRSSALPALAA